MEHDLTRSDQRPTCRAPNVFSGPSVDSDSDDLSGPENRGIELDFEK